MHLSTSMTWSSTQAMTKNKNIVAAIENFPKPQSVRAIPQSLSLSGYYRWFIKDYAKLANPISEPLKNEREWEC